MAEKIIQSRVKQRFATLAEWQATWATFKPLKGEVCKIQIPANTAVTGLTTSSAVRVMTKTGDGETTLENLPWDSALVANETSLSKGTDATAAKTLTHGGTFTAITETSVSGHKVTDTTTTFTMPTETSVSVDQATATTTTTLKHGGTVNVVTAVAKGNTSHNVDVTTTTIKLPSETSLSKGTDSTAAATLTHGGTFTAVTDTTVNGHEITDTTTTYTLPAETELSVDQGTATSSKPSHGGTVTVVSGVTKGDSGHNIDVAKTTITLPAETAVSVDTLTEATGTLTHGGTFTALTSAVKGNTSHNIDVTPTKFTLPAETAVNVTATTGSALTPAHSGKVTVVTGVAKGTNSHDIKVTTQEVTLPAETSLSKGTDTAGTATTLAHGGKFSAVTDTTVSGHAITDVVTEFTLPAETNLSKGTATTATAVLSHGGTFSAITGTSVSKHKITDTVTTFTLPSETTLSKGSDTNSAETLTHGGTFTAVTDTTVNGHTVTDVVTEFTMPSETAVSVDTLSANTKTLTHGETFTVLTAAAKGETSHNIDVTPTTFTLPAMPTGAMIFKGTLGTNGSVTALPSNAVAGWSYKVITAGTYGGNSCTVGDMLVYDGSTWVLIPSGDDEKKGTVTSVATGQGLSGGTITTSGTIKHVDTTRTDTTSTATGSHGGTVTVVDGVTTNSMGHVTGVNVKTVTLPGETTLTKGTDQSTATTATSLNHGDTFTVMTDTSVSGHTITDKNTTFKLPSETAIVTDQLTGTAKTLTHGGTVDVITAVAKGNTSHNVNVTKTTLTLPAETVVNVTATTGSALTPAHGGKVTLVTGVAKGTNSHDVKVTTQEVQWPSQTSLSKGADATGTAVTLTHGGTFTAMTDTTVSNHQITDTNTTFTLPAETQLSKGTDATAAKSLSFGGTFAVVTDTAVSNHKITDTTTTFTMPSETKLSKGTDSTVAATLTHGGTFTAITETVVDNHKITDTTTTYTLPAETQLAKGTDATAAKTLEFGKTFTAVTDTSVSNHTITDTTTTFTMPSETTLSKGTDSTAAVTLTHGGTFTAVTDTAVSGHKITDTTTTFTMPAETALSIDQGTANSSKPAHGSTVTVVTGVTKGDSSHNIDVAKTTITFPSETTLSKATDATPATQTLSHGGTFTALTDLTVSGHAITDKPTTFTLPSETPVTVTPEVENNPDTAIVIQPATPFPIVQSITNDNHDIKFVTRFLTLPPKPVEDPTTSSLTASHGGTITVVDDITRGPEGHVVSFNKRTITLPSDNDTKNTAGGGNTSSKIYIVGTLKQETGTSYTHDTAYVGTDGCLYSGGSKVLTSYTNTKNTAGATNTSSKIYLVGATSQDANPQTYSHDTAYVGTDGHLYSNSSKVFSTSYAPEGYLQWGGQSVSGGVTPIGMSLSEEHSGNKAAFINGNAITVEYSTDGTNFTDAGIAKADKTALFTTSYSVPIGGNTAMTSSNYTKLKTRITLTAQDGASGYYLYTDVKKLLVNMSTAVSTNMLIETMQGDSTSWVTYGTYSVTGWSGWNDIPLMITLGGGSNQKDRPWKVRFTFSLASCNTSYSTTKHISGFRIFGQNSWNVPSALGRTGHLYEYDINQNATFPAGLNTTGNLTENGVRVSKTGHTHSVTAKGTISTPTFTGTAASHNHSFTGTEAGHTHTFTGTAASHDHSFTGTKHKHTFTGTAVTSGGASATASIYQITGVGSLPSHTYTAPSLTASVSNQCLTLSWSAGEHDFSEGSLPTRSSITVAKAHTHSVTAAGTIDEVAAAGTVGSKSVTPAGTIAETKITPAGTVANKSITPAGTISQPTFTGTAVTSGGSSN